MNKNSLMDTGSQSLSQEQLIAVGKVAKPHGIKGELKIFLYSGNPADFAFYDEIQLQMPDGRSSQNYPVTDHRGHGKFTIVRLEGVDDRNSADLLQGCIVQVAIEDLPPIEDDEFFWHDLIGLEVVTDTGRNLGKVVTLLETGGQDILVIRQGRKEYLIPAQDEFIDNIDLEAKVLIVSPPPGLLEIND